MSVTAVVVLLVGVDVVLAAGGWLARRWPQVSLPVAAGAGLGGAGVVLIGCLVGGVR
ncbi:hypothetical protein [Acidipropionibacterium timonense]|uniref:hypothetical protein n=1 Tax=Acidipropionibacterium timonense TaxID=2161818 RepID=UPI001436BCE4|nr:hypothetical protein [Acidipropionibacterium timonense]